MTGASVVPLSRSLRHAPTLALGGLLALLLAALAACGGTSSGTTASTGGSSANAGVVSVSKTSLGSVVVAHSGLTVYLLTSDKPGALACTGGCLQLWHPVAAPPGSAEAAGVTAKLAALHRPDGGRQLTLDGRPVYTFTGDSKAGQTKGEGVQDYGGTWWAVSPSGAAVKGASGNGGGGGGGGGGGYGY